MRTISIILLLFIVLIGCKPPDPDPTPQDLKNMAADFVEKIMPPDAQLIEYWDNGWLVFKSHDRFFLYHCSSVTGESCIYLPDYIEVYTTRN